MAQWQGYGEQDRPLGGQPAGSDPGGGGTPPAGWPGPAHGQPGPYDSPGGYPGQGYQQAGYGQPGHGQQAYGQPGYPQPHPYQYAAPQQTRGTNTMAILALVLAFVFAPLGLIFGIIARRQIRQTGEDGDGLALLA